MGSHFDKDSGVQCVAFADDKRLFSASGNSVIELDLTTTKIISMEARCILRGVCDEEINQVSIHHKGRHMALADDNGQVKILDISRHPPSLSKTLYSTPSNRKKSKKKGKNDDDDDDDDAMCTCALFRPRVPWDLAAGYLNCGVAFW